MAVSNDIVICSPLRTPVGRMGGALAPLSATELATLVLRELVRRTGLGEGDVDDVAVIWDNTLTRAPFDSQQWGFGTDVRRVIGDALAEDVGPGDIRSIIRGHVLATYTAARKTTDIRTLAALADRLAAERAGLSWDDPVQLHRGTIKPTTPR